MLSLKCPVSTIVSAALCTLFIVTGLAGTSISASESVKEKANPYADTEIAIKIIPSVNKTFGYDILVHGRPLVHQPNIPALPGNKGFASREKALAAAELVVTKIRNNEMPPTVTIEELNNIGALK